MELSGEEGVCPCTSMAVRVPQHVPLYTVHMSIASEVCNTVYTCLCA